MNIYLISDVHGCQKTLQELLNKIALSKEDQLYFLGDYINKGPRSKQVIDDIIKLKKQNYKITTLLGNHEEFVLREMKSKTYTGSPETLKSFNINNIEELQPKYINWMQNLKKYVVTKDFILVHAGLNFLNKNPFENENDLLRIRNWHNTIDYDWLGNKTIIHGHNTIKRKEIEKLVENVEKNKVIDIDNGGFLKGKKGFGSLCCLELNSKKLFFQENID